MAALAGLRPVVVRSGEGAVAGSVLVDRVGIGLAAAVVGPDNMAHSLGMLGFGYIAGSLAADNSLPSFQILVLGCCVAACRIGCAKTCSASVVPHSGW